MDSDYGRGNPAAKITRDEPSSPPTPVETVYVEDKKESQLPYLAQLSAFSILFLSILYSLSALATYLVERLLIKQEAGNFDYSYFYGGDSFLVISAVSTLIVALPAAALLLFCVRRAEGNEAWRSGQKWRRIIYTIMQVVLIISIICTLVGTVYSVFSHSLGLETSSSYYDISNEPKEGKSVGNEIAAAVISGFASVVIFCLGMVTFMAEYSKKWRRAAWGILALFAMTAGIVGTVSVIKVQEDIKKDNGSQSNYDQNYDDYPGSEPSGISAASTLASVKSDLNYYASKHNGTYPTKEQWDNGSLKPTYLLSNSETLKKITYTPTCTASEPLVCSGYTVSMKDEDGKTITLTSDSASAS